AEEQALLGGDESPAAAASVPGGYLTSRRGRVVRSGASSARATVRRCSSLTPGRVHAASRPCSCSRA
ncbi:MAG TPA: hypothetical protein PK308_10490, partial [Phycisphaerales bacterium]|nr:hypothetical protein [Phycisphaerales bacterium]